MNELPLSIYHPSPRALRFSRPPITWYLIQAPKKFFLPHEKTWYRRFKPLLGVFPYDEQEAWQDLLQGTQVVFGVINKQVICYMLIDVLNLVLISKRVLYFHAGVILPEYRRMKLTSKMTHLHLKYLPEQWWGHYFAARTFSPRAYGVSRRMGLVYPSPSQDEIPADIRYIGLMLATHYFKARKIFDLKTFTFKGIYSKPEKFFKDGKLAVEFDRDDTINTWLLRRINHENGDAQLFIGRLAWKNFFQMNYFRLKPF